jgi:hypothetical protein
VATSDFVVPPGTVVSDVRYRPFHEQPLQSNRGNRQAAEAFTRTAKEKEKAPRSHLERLVREAEKAAAATAAAPMPQPSVASAPAAVAAVSALPAAAVARAASARKRGAGGAAIGVPHPQHMQVSSTAAAAQGVTAVYGLMGDMMMRAQQLCMA